MQDNLNTHTAAALYETFPPAEARRILERVEWNSTRHSRELVTENERESPRDSSEG